MTKSDQEAYQKFLDEQEKQFKERFEKGLNILFNQVESVDPELANQMLNIKRDRVKG